MIRSTFYGFNIAASGMNMAQKALDLTGNNMANMDTVGYTRQRLDLSSIPSANYTDRYAPYRSIQIGQGVDITRVAQLRDPYLDNRFRREASSIGELDANLSTMNDISRIFDQVQYEGLQKAFDNFTSQLQSYSTQTGEVTLDGTVRAAAESILRLFNQYADQVGNVREYQQGLLEENTIPKVNGMLENLATLNKNIRECEIYGNPALELKDQRNLLLDELSAYIKIDVTYTPDPDPMLKGVDICKVSFICDNPTTDGFTEDLRTLVNGKEFAQIGFNAPEPTSADPDRQETYITIKAVTKHLYSKATHDALPQSGIPDDPKTAFDESLDMRNPPDAPENALNTPIEFTTGAIKGALDMLNSEGAFDNPPNTVNGIGYYEKMLDRFAADFAATFNEANKALDPGWEPTFGPDPNWTGNPAETPTITVKPNPDYPAVPGATETIPDPASDHLLDRPLFLADDGGTTITAKNIVIAEGWKSGQYTLTTTKKTPVTTDTADGDVSGDTNNLVYMIDLLNRSFNFTTDGIGATTGNAIYSGTFEQVFNNIGLIAAQDASSKEKALSANTNVITGIEELRNSLSSVNMDEEGVNLLRFQKSYAAAARVMTTLDEALDVLINRTGVVGR